MFRSTLLMPLLHCAALTFRTGPVRRAAYTRPWDPLRRETIRWAANGGAGDRPPQDYDPDELFREIEDTDDEYDDDFDGEIIEAGGDGDDDGRLLVKFSKDMGCDRKELGDVEGDVRDLQRILGIRDYDMSIHFCTDREIQELNKMYRGMDKPTDILSFSSPFIDFSAPEVMAEPEFEDTPKDIGDVLISVPYVQRLIEEDKSDLYGRDGDVDRGVSAAMATLYTLEERMPLLLIHGMLHLLGHDHEEDGDYEKMVCREEEVLAEFSKRRGGS